MKIAQVKKAMRQWQTAARQFGPTSESAKHFFFEYRRLADEFTAATHVRLTSYLLGDIEYVAQPEWVAEARAIADRMRSEGFTN